MIFLAVLFGAGIVALLGFPLFETREQTDAARGSTLLFDAELPDQRLPSSGPYLSEEDIVARAVEFARSRGVADPRVTETLLTTYEQSTRRNPMEQGTFLHPDREVYVVEIDGEMTIWGGERSAGPYRRSYYVFDATLGDLLEWGATDESPNTD